MNQDLKLEKPVPEIRTPIMDYHKMMDYIEKKYDIKVRDYDGIEKRKDQYQKDNNVCLYASPRKYGGKYHIPFKKEDGSFGGYREGTKQEYDEGFKEYRRISTEYVEWEKTQPVLQRLDYWMWLLTEHFGGDCPNGSDHYINIDEILEDEETPEWAKEITQLIQDEFEEHLDDGGLDVHVWW